jgi:hypothetical protein
MPETRNKDDREVREGAVRVIEETGELISRVVRYLGVHRGTWTTGPLDRRAQGGLGRYRTATPSEQRHVSSTRPWPTLLEGSWAAGPAPRLQNRTPLEFLRPGPAGFHRRWPNRTWSSARPPDCIRMPRRPVRRARRRRWGRASRRRGPGVPCSLEWEVPSRHELESTAAARPVVVDGAMGSTTPSAGTARPRSCHRSSAGAPGLDRRCALT